MMHPFTITHDEELVEVDFEIDIPIPKVLVANAMWSRDLTAAEASHRAKLERLLGRSPEGGHWPLSVPYRCWEDPPGHWQTEGISCCGLVYDGIADRSGCAWSWAGKPYHCGTAVARDESEARREQEVIDLGQWVNAPPTWDVQTRPHSGDGVIVYMPGNTLATHICMACWWQGNALVSVDGGQALAEDGFLQSVRLRTREWHVRGGKWWLGDRIVHGWICTQWMPWRGKFLAPAGWEGIDLP